LELNRIELEKQLLNSNKAIDKGLKTCFTILPYLKFYA